MRIRLISAVTFLCLLVALPAAAAKKQEDKVADATDVLDQFLRIPEQSIPPSMLARAHGIAVIPSVYKIGFGVGARRGKGILVVRQDNNEWSNPAFITLTGGSFGFQVGANSTDIILVFKSRKSINNIANGKFTLGADAAVAAGPVGRHGAVATDHTFRSEVFSYSRSRGLFAGVSLEGAGVTMDRKANAAFYGSSSITPEQIFRSSPSKAPNVANNFLQVLTAQTRRLPKARSMQANSATAGVSESAPATVKTYGIGDPNAPESGDVDFNDDF